MPVVMDTMENSLRMDYASWPERLFIINEGKVVMIGGEGPFDYDVNKVEDWLKKNL